MTASHPAGSLPEGHGHEAPPLAGLIDRVMAVLECVGDDAGGSPTLSDISRRTGLPLSTVHRLLASLVGRGMIERRGRHYALGHRLRRITDQQTHPEDRHLCRVSHPHLVEHLTATGLPVALAILRDQRVRYLEALCPTAHPAADAYLAVHAPVHCTAAGKLLLAFGRGADLPAVAEPYLGLAPATITERRRFDQELRRIRHEGISFARAERLPDIVDIAAPVRDGAGRVIAAVSVAGRVGEIRPLAAARDIRRTADRISAAA